MVGCRGSFPALASALLRGDLQAKPALVLLPSSLFWGNLVKRGP